MRIALITDIHANLPALEAVLSDVKAKRHADLILSLGDQVNLGPCPRETLELLRAHNVTCLHGNHEGYLLKAMQGDPAFSGANFDVVRFQAALLREEEITFPRTMELDGITFCHAMPHDDRFPVWNPEKAIPLLRAMTFDRPTHIICGHGHNPTHLRMGNLTLDSIGSAGCMDDGPAGAAPYAMLETGPDYAVIRPFYASYDTAPLPGLFLASGMADACPVTARIACAQMLSNVDYLLPFVIRAWQIAGERGESAISEETWRLTDSLFPWPDGQTADAFWRAARAKAAHRSI